MTLALIGQRKGHSLNCISNSKEVRDLQKDFSEDIGLASILEKKKSGTERTLTNEKENGTEMPIL